MMIAIDIAWFMPVDEFKSRMDHFIRDIKAAKPRRGVTEILVPGEIDHRREMAYRQHGARLDAVIFDQLAELAQKLDIDFPFEREVVA